MDSKQARRTETHLLSTLTSVCRRNSCCHSSPCWSGWREWRSPGCSRCLRLPWRDRRGFLGRSQDTHSSLGTLGTLIKEQLLGLCVVRSHVQEARSSQTLGEVNGMNMKTNRFGSSVLLLLQSSWTVLTWSGLTGHGVLLDVRAHRVGVVTGLVDPPVGPLAKQNPAGGGRRRDQRLIYGPFSSTR